jgi:hypothetical protein
LTTLAIDTTTGDLSVVNNELVFLSGGDEVTQRLSSRLRMIAGEWFLDTLKGVDYRGIVWVKGMSQTLIAAEFKRNIITTPGVAALLAYEQTFDVPTRKLSVNLSAQPIDGDVIDFSGVFG